MNGRTGEGPTYTEADLRPIVDALTALRDGDSSGRVTVAADGALGEMAGIVNEIMGRRRHVSRELNRVKREVAREGRLSARLEVIDGARGDWADNLVAVNDLIESLVQPTLTVGRIVDAVADGQLTERMPLERDGRPVRGDVRWLAKAVNRMVDQLALFTGAVTHVSREVGTDGRLGGQARLRGMSGSWREVTQAVNTMASRLTAQVRDIAEVMTAVAGGDLTRKVTVDAAGEMQELKLTVNTMVDQLSAFADEVTRMAREVGTEGKLGGQASVRGVSGVWKDLTDNVNFMAGNLTSQVRSIAQVATAVANGDLSKKITVDAQGEILRLKDTINTMVDQLSAFADEVTRMAREVGTEGRLGGQAQVRGVSGVWKDLTDNVNFMADNLTSQVRSIAQVTTAVAQGDLSKKIDVDARGEILELKTTINTMVDTLSSFSSEVTRMAREVGSEGRLGGQAEVEGVSGTWKRLTEGVNELAGNLTTQVRAIAEVASAVARGDLTRSITVDARGEVAELKDNINLMVAHLRETTTANQEQDWLKTNLARIAGLMQGHRDLMQVARLILSELTPLASAQYGAFYLTEPDGPADAPLRLLATYGLPKGKYARFRRGEGLVGQAAVERKRILITDVPPDYVKISSGLGESAPASIVIMPILFEDEVLGVLELASFGRFSDMHLAFFDQFVGTIGVTVNTIIANSRTESLLTESQRLTQELRERSDELQRQQAELRRSNAELEDKAALLAKQNRAIEVQNFQIEQARRALEERAEQLALSSRYKSEFLANMSHELRTPLNSLLVLAKLLTENADGNLTDKQVEFARTIYDSGSDLLQLINDILDLSKVEAGKMDVHAQNLPLAQLVDYVDATFRPMALDKGLGFSVEVSPDVPERLFADEQRLQQILRNLLSNAVKFTSAGAVRLSISPATGVEFVQPSLRETGEVLAFAVSDTGIGIAEDKLRVIFDAFQQADGTTSRRYGGTGLGLSISRDIAQLLGGEIHAESRLGHGSTFTLYLPPAYREPEPGSGLRRGPGSAAVPVLSRTPPAVGRGGHTPDGQSGALFDEILSSAGPDETLIGHKVLIVDDDVRNVFALTSVLERYGVEVLYAENGREGIDVLERNEDIELVLMDVMMPELDGYATTEAIRRMPQFAGLPIIALTAKAMKGDREKSIAAGASDYIPKPVEVDTLLSMMRSWIQRSGGDA